MMSDSCLDNNGKVIQRFTYAERHIMSMLLEFKEHNFVFH